MNAGAAAIRTGVRVEWLTIAWMTVEALVSVAAGLAAGSIALIANNPQVPQVPGTKLPKEPRAAFLGT